MPSTPFTCCSIGAATVLATSSALAPGKTAVTSTVGGAISGYCATGSVHSARKPPNVTTMDSTEAKIGRSMKNFENTERPLLFPHGPPHSPLGRGLLTATRPLVVRRGSPGPCRSPGLYSCDAGRADLFDRQTATSTMPNRPNVRTTSTASRTYPTCRTTGLANSVVSPSQLMV